MPKNLIDRRPGGFSAYLTAVVRGANEARLRASWRFLLALTLLPLVTLLVKVVMPLLGLSGVIPGGPIQALIFLVLLGMWAWAIDRRPLTDYGVSLSHQWLLNLLAGLGAVLVAHLLWYGLCLAAGWTTIELAMTAPQDSLAVGLVGMVLSLGLNVWVQDTVYYAIVLRTAAEGLKARDLPPTRAATGALLVAVLFFTVIHSAPTPIELLDYLLAGIVFGVLYLYTGELALTIGVHWGISATAGVLFPVASMTDGSPSVFQVTEGLTGVFGTLSANRMPQLVIIFVLLIGWLKWRNGTVNTNTSITQWIPRKRGLMGTVPSTGDD